MTTQGNQIRLGTFERFMLQVAVLLIASGVLGAVAVYREIGEVRVELRDYTAAVHTLEARLAAVEARR